MSWEAKRKDARTDPIEEVTIFEQYPVASWTAASGIKVCFPIVPLTETGGNRIIERERPFRDGAKLDDTGRKAARFVMTAIFQNSINEPGLSENGLPLYPDIMNMLLETLTTPHETGDLVVPTRGPIRARCESYSRREDASQRDMAMVDITWVEDNEDNVDAAALAVPSVNANAIELAKATEFTAEEEGAWDGSLQDLRAALENLEGLANAPFTYAQDLESQAKMVMGMTDNAIEAFSHPNMPGRDMFCQPEGARAQRNLHKAKEMAGQTRTASRTARPQKTTVVFELDQSFARICSMIEGIDIEDLMAANPTIDPFWIPAGTQVKLPFKAGQFQKKG